LIPAIIAKIINKLPIVFISVIFLVYLLLKL
jgi:hypothetical protein